MSPVEVREGLGQNLDNGGDRWRRPCLDRFDTAKHLGRAVGRPTLEVEEEVTDGTVDELDDGLQQADAPIDENHVSEFVQSRDEKRHGLIGRCAERDCVVGAS